MKKNVSKVRHELTLVIPLPHQMEKARTMLRRWGGITIDQSAIEPKHLMLYGELQSLIAAVHSLGQCDVILYFETAYTLE